MLSGPQREPGEGAGSRIPPPASSPAACLASGSPCSPVTARHGFSQRVSLFTLQLRFQEVTFVSRIQASLPCAHSAVPRSTEGECVCFYGFRRDHRPAPVPPDPEILMNRTAVLECGRSQGHTHAPRLAAEPWRAGRRQLRKFITAPRLLRYASLTHVWMKYGEFSSGFGEQKPAVLPLRLIRG